MTAYRGGDVHLTGHVTGMQTDSFMSSLDGVGRPTTWRVEVDLGRGRLEVVVDAEQARAMQEAGFIEVTVRCMSAYGGAPREEAP